MVKTIPRQAFLDVGEAIGILHDGQLVLDTEDVSGVVSDCCLYEWFEGGRNLVQRYAEKIPSTPRGADESYLLKACQQAHHPVIFRAALEAAGIPAARAVHVGDSYTKDVLGAVGAGMTAMLLQREGAPPPDPGHGAQEPAVTVVRDLGEVVDRLGVA